MLRKPYRRNATPPYGSPTCYESVRFMLKKWFWGGGFDLMSTFLIADGIQASLVRDPALFFLILVQGGNYMASASLLLH